VTFLEKLDTADLEKLLSAMIMSREVIDDSKNERLIEKIRLFDRTALIKYGYDGNLKHESLIYKTFLEKNYQVPKVLSNNNIGGMNILALEWIDGEHPDFSSPDHIELVFSTLGTWAASWSTNVKNYFNEFGEKFPNFSILSKLLNDNRETLTKLLGENLIEFLTKECLEKGELVLKNIQRTSLTLDPGDISLHNFIINAKNEVYFIDFESCAIRPVIMLFEHIGEDYGSIPNTQGNIQLAIESFLNEWNNRSAKKMDWDDFLYSHLNARIYYKIGDFNYWINRILKDHDIPQTLEWINDGRKQMTELLLRLKHTA